MGRDRKHSCRQTSILHRVHVQEVHKMSQSHLKIPQDENRKIEFECRVQCIRFYVVWMHSIYSIYTIHILFSHPSLMRNLHRIPFYITLGTKIHKKKSFR